ncbi:Detoxification 46 protein [Thalictrum thalictroides]|uniref:Protein DETOXIFICATION n=1 Tax=Thalictrum thalictroides TaxID=46969 RepID=A0A7J6WZ56_THATH|nr:Detoxification 46 protein [Thalictrum thalictroides]
MDIKLKILSPPSIQNHKKNTFLSPSIRFFHSSSLNISRVYFTSTSNHPSRFTKTSCISPVDQDHNSFTREDDDLDKKTRKIDDSDSDTDLIATVQVVEEGVGKEEFSGNESIFKQIQEIILFTGPAVGLWICGPLTSLIDTAVVGQGSSLELAALGPATVVSDYASKVFMFLSIATSNMVATSLAREGKKEVQHKISMLLFVGFTCGLGMLLLTKVAGAQLLTTFAGPKNLNVVPAANTYAQVAFYALLTYSVTSMGTMTMAAHQVMIQLYYMCTVWGEPLSQTAQSFMPELIFGIDRSLKKARRLLKSLLIIGAITGSVLGIIGTAVPWFFPHLFTADTEVVGEMHKVLLAYWAALVVTPATHSLEGTLMAGQDLRFLSISMIGCFSLGGLLLLLMSSRGYGVLGCWVALAGFLWQPPVPDNVLRSYDGTVGMLNSAFCQLSSVPSYRPQAICTGNGVFPSLNAIYVHSAKYRAMGGQRENAGEKQAGFPWHMLEDGKAYLQAR